MWRLLIGNIFVSLKFLTAAVVVADESSGQLVLSTTDENIMFNNTGKFSAPIDC